MPTEEEIKKLAHSLWEKEGRPGGKDVEHYFRAKKMLEEKESAQVIELPPVPRRPELAPPSSVSPPTPPVNKRRKQPRRKK